MMMLDVMNDVNDMTHVSYHHAVDRRANHPREGVGWDFAGKSLAGAVGQRAHRFVPRVLVEGDALMLGGVGLEVEDVGQRAELVLAVAPFPSFLACNRGEAVEDAAPTPGAAVVPVLCHEG